MNIKSLCSQIANKIVIESKAKLGRHQTSEYYWSRHNVTGHYEFKSAEESTRFFDWRSMQYLGYLELMPVDRADGKMVLDYGCGPGHDLVGFTTRSNTKKLIGLDVSPTSIEEAKRRLSLHNSNVEFILLDENYTELPIADNSIDIIHSSGVLHHIKDLPKVLKELKRIMSDNGYMQVMVYNYDSIWLHLFTYYMKQIKDGILTNMSKREANSKFTDGYDCPISNCYKAEEFISIVESEGMKCEFTGAAISILEMKILHERFSALMSPKVDAETRNFLYDLTFNEKGLPLYNGQVAGLDACYRITKY